jgi:hypothetical protein
MKLDAPVPGQSLTTTPRNSPWESPPLFDTAEETLGFYLDKLDDNEFIDDLFFTFEQGMPISAVVEGMTSIGVMEGYHTFDVKMLISPVLHEHLKTLADAAGISYKENYDPSKEEQMSEKTKKRTLLLIEKDMGIKPQTPSTENTQQASEMLTEIVPTKPTGLIPRRV